MPTVCYSRKQLDEAELYYIQKYDCVNSEDYYNLSIGGTGGWEQYDSSGEKNGMYGVHRFGEENPMYGKHQSEEARKKMSEAIKNRGGHFGENNPMYGRKQSDEQKLKTKIAKSDEFGNYIYVGEKAVNFGKHETHPCFGLHWYNNGIVSVKAKECPEGFVEGRLMKNSTCPYCDF